MRSPFLSFHLAASTSAAAIEHQIPSVLLNHQNRFHLACFRLSCERFFQDDSSNGARFDRRYNGWLCVHNKCTYQAFHWYEH